jgi:hypothetical protein
MAQPTHPTSALRVGRGRCLHPPALHGRGTGLFVGSRSAPPLARTAPLRHGSTGWRAGHRTFAIRPLPAGRGDVQIASSVLSDRALERCCSTARSGSGQQQPRSHDMCSPLPADEVVASTFRRRWRRSRARGRHQPQTKQRNRAVEASHMCDDDDRVSGE